MSELLYFLLGLGVGSIGLLVFLTFKGYIQEPLEHRAKLECPNNGCAFKIEGSTSAVDKEYLRRLEYVMDSHISVCQRRAH